ncbi:acetyl-coenzyme A synthetase, partial [Proteus mirabilis]|uniref:acetyl-coenzyme A synthetase N-terminal domain-containing protein n=1 Tax=Proteus mirabilis TaxID=584 RepID=UPI002576DA78
MTKINKHHIPANISEHALINKEQYQKDYALSIENPEAYWADKGKIVEWITPYTIEKNTSLEPGHVRKRWYEDG